MPQNLTRGDAKSHHEISEVLRYVSWDDLRLFLTTAEQSSFRKAAKILKINPATLVRRIERLEYAMGSRLFVRNTDGVSVTVEGRKIMENARAMELAISNIVRQRQVTEDGIRGLVRISITEGLGTYWTLPKLLEFQKLNRFLIIDLQQSMQSPDVSRLLTDISIDYKRPEQPDLITVQLGYMHTYPFASTSYTNIFGIPKSLSELKSHRIVQQTSPFIPEGVYERLLGVESLEGIVGVRTNTSTAVLYAVERGSGIGGTLPTYALRWAKTDSDRCRDKKSP